MKKIRKTTPDDDADASQTQPAVAGDKPTRDKKRKKASREPVFYKHTTTPSTENLKHVIGVYTGFPYT